jgi:hypothetical protein
MFYIILSLIVLGILSIPLIFWFQPYKKIASLSELHIVVSTIELIHMFILILFCSC